MKQHSKNIVLSILCYFILSLFLGASDNNDLQIAYSKCKKAMDYFDYSTLKQEAGNLMELAHTHKDKNMEGEAHLFLGIRNLFNGDGKDALPDIDKALQIAEKLGNDSLACTALNCKGIYEANVNVNPYMAQHFFVRSINIAKKHNIERIICSLNTNLAQLAIQQKDTTGLPYAQEAYIYGQTYDKPHLRANGATELAILHYLAGHLEESEKYYDIALRHCRQDSVNLFGYLYDLRSKQMFDHGNLSEAREFAKKSIEKFKDTYVVELPTSYLQLARVEYALGEYDSAIKTLREGIAAITDYSSYTVLPEIYDLMAKAYTATGNLPAAIECLYHAKDASDSTRQTDSRHLKIQRDMMLELAEKEKETAIKTIRISYLSRINLLMGILVALLILGGVLIILHNRRKKQLYDNIVLQNQKLIAAEEQLTKAIPKEEEAVAQPKSAENATSTNQAVSVPNGKALFDKATSLMREKRLYADPRFTREAFIDMLETNKTYLSQIIQEYAGTNYAQWINSYRIKEAVGILADKTQRDYPLKQLSTDVGFGSLTSFYKAFKAEIGISPADYRKSALNLQ